MKIPSGPISLMSLTYKKIFPVVHEELKIWKAKAEKISDPELRKQALASIQSKQFHCEGGSILALLAEDLYGKAVPFIVAYQTISDYLDNLCDRSTSLDPNDFAALHESMEDALTVGAPHRDYYRFRKEKDDGGYLKDLVTKCQNALGEMEHYPLIKKYLLELCSYYCDLQVHKHVKKEERVPRLKTWFNQHRENFEDLTWYEFSACTGSTLGIFCLVSSAMQKDFKEQDAISIHHGYFPYVQGLHIMLDYLIDQAEDIEGGDLNFCTYYESDEQLLQRMKMFVREADRHTKNLPNAKFHKMINRGLLGLYLSDWKVAHQPNVRLIANQLVKAGGKISSFFYFNSKAYRKLQTIFG